MGNGHNIKILFRLLRKISFHNTVVFTVLRLWSKLTIVIIIIVLFAENVFTVFNEMFVQRFKCVCGLVIGILVFFIGIPLKWATAKLVAPLAKTPIAEIFGVFTKGYFDN